MGRITAYLLWAFGISWSIAGIGYISGVRSSEHAIYIVVAGLCMLGPALAAIIRQRLFDRAPWSGLGLVLKGTNWKVLAWTVVLGMAIVPCFLGVVALGEALHWTAFGHVSITQERITVALGEMMQNAGGPVTTEGSLMELVQRIPAGIVLLCILLFALLAAVTFNLPFMLGEELGWRGYLWQHTSHWSGLHRVLFTGLVWGLWHAPLIAMGHNYPGHPINGIGLMVIFCTVLAFLFDWTRTRSRSIWSSCVLHGLINGTAGATAIFSWGGHVLIGSVAGLAGCLAIGMLVVSVLVLDPAYRRELGRPTGS